jgi:hypothetical protein
MPIQQNFALPKAISDLVFPASTGNTFFVAFLASKDPKTQKPWCPDVVAALPTLESTFTGAKKPQAAFVEVGQRPEYFTLSPNCLSLSKTILRLTTTACFQMERSEERLQNYLECEQRAGSR